TSCCQTSGVNWSDAVHLGMLIQHLLNQPGCSIHFATVEKHAGAKSSNQRMIRLEGRAFIEFRKRFLPHTLVHKNAGAVGAGHDELSWIQAHHAVIAS